MFKPSSRPSHNRQIDGLRQSTILFRASVDFRVFPPDATGLGSSGLPGFCSLSAPSSFVRDIRGFRPHSFPSTGFHNLATGIVVRSDLRVYSTPLALLGSWPSEFDCLSDRRTIFSPTCFYAVPTPPRFPSWIQRRSLTSTPQQLTCSLRRLAFSRPLVILR
jgi:hypothetical protein